MSGQPETIGTTPPKLRVSTIEASRLVRLRHASTLLESIRLAAEAVRIADESVRLCSLAAVSKNPLPRDKKLDLLFDQNQAHIHLLVLLNSIPSLTVTDVAPTEESILSVPVPAAATCPSSSPPTPSN